MKKFLLIALMPFAGLLHAQQALTVEEYGQMKAAGQLDPQTKYTIIPSPRNNSGSGSAVSRYSGPVQAQSLSCNCMLPLDTSFHVVPFYGYTGPLYSNDDGSAQIVLPFSFNFFGTPVDTVYINNNGNISVGASYPTFTSTGFPTTSFQMIAPFWADVDTRAGGVVYYQITPTHMIVKWDSVGYYAMHNNLINEFQLIITDGTDTLLPAGTNVSFCYGDMQWTTGDASSGTGGFGGSPATVGVNMGNGTDYFQVSQTDQAGNLFDGPYGNNDGVDWLDNLELYFNTANTGNVPPLVLNNTICDTIDVYTGDTLRSIYTDSVQFTMYFMTPEPDQIVTDTIFSNAPASNFHYSPIDISGPYKSYLCTFIAQNLPPGVYTVTGSADDNGSPSAHTNSSVHIHTYYDAALGVHEQQAGSFNVFPNPADDHLSIDRRSNNTATVIITNAIGQQCASVNITGTHNEISTKDLAPGIYFISVRNDDGSVQTMKFVRQ